MLTVSRKSKWFCWDGSVSQFHFPLTKHTSTYAHPKQTSKHYPSSHTTQRVSQCQQQWCNLTQENASKVQYFSTCKINKTNGFKCRPKATQLILLRNSRKLSVPVYHKARGNTNLLLTIPIIWGATVSILGLSVKTSWCVHTVLVNRSRTTNRLLLKPRKSPVSQILLLVSDMCS